METDATRAPAKINLALHVVGTRADGYHLLDSLVVFAGVGDEIRVTPSADLALSVNGPQAAALGTGPDNLVLRAARLFDATQGATITLTKNLPVASGIGGGSADAAATLHALSRLWGLPMPAIPALLTLGADVPACVNGHPLRMRGIGEDLSAVPPLPNAYLVLVNPGIGHATPAVFRALTTKTNRPLPETVPEFTDAADLAGWLDLQRNDLERPAESIAPMISAVKAALATQPGCLLARMSGSGATCFGLFAAEHSAAMAAAAIRSAHPAWWVTAAPILR